MTVPMPPRNTSNGFLGDPENLKSAKGCIGRGRFDWCTCPHGCNWRRCAGDEPDCAFIRHHFASDVPLEDALLINLKDWPTDPTVILQQVSTAASTRADMVGMYSPRCRGEAVKP